MFGLIQILKTFPGIIVIILLFIHQLRKFWNLLKIRESLCGPGTNQSHQLQISNTSTTSGMSNICIAKKRKILYFYLSFILAFLHARITGIERGLKHRIVMFVLDQMLKLTQPLKCMSKKGKECGSCGMIA